MFDAHPSGLTICVLGGTGFVGTDLVARLVADGHWVRVPTRNRSRGVQLRVLDTVELTVANIHDARVLGQLFTGVDVVINLVGILNETAGCRFESVHTELAAKVVTAAAAAKVRRLLHMSSLGAGDQAPSHYLRSKAAAEARVREAPPDLEWAIFRPSVIFGSGDSLTRRFARLLKLSGGILPLARSQARFAPISAQDVADAFVRVLYLRGSLNDTYELCGPDIMTLEQIVRTTAKAAHMPCHILRLPDFAARLQGLVMGLLPGKPFSLDNYRSLTLDSVCRQDGCAILGIEPQHMESLLPLYLGSMSEQAQLELYRDDRT